MLRSTHRLNAGRSYGRSTAFLRPTANPCSSGHAPRPAASQRPGPSSSRAPSSAAPRPSCTTPAAASPQRQSAAASRAPCQDDEAAGPQGAPAPAAGTTGFSDGPDRTPSAARRLPGQAETVMNPVDTAPPSLFSGLAVAEKPLKQDSDLDYLAELLALQRSDGPKALGFFGTRNMGLTHQKLVEVLAYAFVSTGNHIFTSGASGTNAAVIKGALRAQRPELLTVILPQSLSRQPFESQGLLGEVGDLVEMPQHDSLSLLEASRLCNREIISRVQQVISFAFHDSRLILEAATEAKAQRKIVTLFYLD